MFAIQLSNLAHPRLSRSPPPAELARAADLRHVPGNWGKREIFAFLVFVLFVAVLHILQFNRLSTENEVLVLIFGSIINIHEIQALSDPDSVRNFRLKSLKSKKKSAVFMR